MHVAKGEEETKGETKEPKAPPIGRA